MVASIRIWGVEQKLITIASFSLFDDLIWFTPKTSSTSAPTCIHIWEGVWSPAPPYLDFGICYILCYILRLKHVDTALQAIDLIGVRNTGSTPAASTKLKCSVV